MGEYCKKEKEIAEMHTDIGHLKRIVMEGNGGEPMVTLMPKLCDNVQTLNEKTIPDLQKGISGFIKYQSEMEGRQEGKDSIRKRNRWVIGILITIIGVLLSAIVAVLLVVV